MPTYEYKCKNCGAVHEYFHSITETKRKCHLCGRHALTRIISGGGAVIFKGSGFHCNDYPKTMGEASDA